MSKEENSSGLLKIEFIIAAIVLFSFLFWGLTSSAFMENDDSQNLSKNSNFIAIGDDPTLDLPWEDSFSHAVKVAKKRNNLILIHMHLQDKNVDYEGKYNVIGENDSEFMMDVYYRLFVMGNDTIKSTLKNQFVLYRMPYPSEHEFNGTKLKEPALLLLYDPVSKKILKQESINYSTFAPDYMGTSTKKAEMEDIENKTLRFSKWLELE
ncbi:hypothetical protein [Methanococcoides burtonii]|uniref:Uncharacterized protein n=1 Tax=Methanococcoides burtonii (strain DSM 6242 / NBRC 107633 / OCM 468 / ACE-M) TaxID=259564 RepID=Q12V89_METBU|nr:hypothetical protein [Methanococcoides burtonii]ABE52637.1 Hypothetical protein Mbur_1747 [Methanococcoides burtonii DSM 6242]